MDETCVLDVADRGPLLLDEIAELSRLTRSRVGQILLRGLFKLGVLLDDEPSRSVPVDDEPARPVS